MYTQGDKSREIKSRVVVNTVAVAKGVGKDDVGFVDNRPMPLIRTIQKEADDKCDIFENANERVLQLCNNRKQKKIKARVEGEKRALRRKKIRMKRAVAYQTNTKNSCRNKMKAIDNMPKKALYGKRGAHGKGKRGSGINSGTKKTLDGLKNRKRRRRRKTQGNS